MPVAALLIIAALIVAAEALFWKMPSSPLAAEAWPMPVSVPVPPMVTAPALLPMRMPPAFKLLAPVKVRVCAPPALNLRVLTEKADGVELERVMFSLSPAFAVAKLVT